MSIPLNTRPGCALPLPYRKNDGNSKSSRSVNYGLAIKVSGRPKFYHVVVGKDTYISSCSACDPHTGNPTETSRPDLNKIVCADALCLPTVENLLKYIMKVHSTWRRRSYCMKVFRLDRCPGMMKYSKIW